MIAPTSGSSVTFTNGDFIDADLAAPQLALQVTGETRQTAQPSGSVIFYLNLVGGVCSLWDEEAQYISASLNLSLTSLLV